MIEVLVFSGDTIVWRCESENEESAIRDARIGWDESWNGLQGQKRAIVFMVDDRIIARSESRP